MQTKKEKARQLGLGINTGLQKKHLHLTQDGHNEIQKWANRNGLTFSAAIEILALQSLESDPLVIMTRAIKSLLPALVQNEFRRQFSRLAQLMAVNNFTGERNGQMLEALLLHMIREEAGRHPDDFENTILVSTDPRDKKAAAIRQLRAELLSYIDEDVPLVLKNQAAKYKAAFPYLFENGPEKAEEEDE
jgi:signal recognition particle subunit SEC65